MLGSFAASRWHRHSPAHPRQNHLAALGLAPRNIRKRSKRGEHGENKRKECVATRWLHFWAARFDDICRQESSSKFVSLKGLGDSHSCNQLALLDSSLGNILQFFISQVFFWGELPPESSWDFKKQRLRNTFSSKNHTDPVAHKPQGLTGSWCSSKAANGNFPGCAPDYLLSVWDWKNERLLLKCKAYGQEGAGLVGFPWSRRSMWDMMKDPGYPIHQAPTPPKTIKHPRREG